MFVKNSRDLYFLSSRHREWNLGNLAFQKPSESIQTIISFVTRTENHHTDDNNGHGAQEREKKSADVSWATTGTGKVFLFIFVFSMQPTTHRGDGFSLFSGKLPPYTFMNVVPTPP